MPHDMNDPSRTAHLNEILARYKADASLQRDYPTVYAWFAANGYDVPTCLLDPPAESPDVEGYLAKLSAANPAYDITDAEKLKIKSYADKWQVHADIRNEFRSFESYAAYMRAKASGLVKHYGRGIVQ